MSAARRALTPGFFGCRTTAPDSAYSKKDDRQLMKRITMAAVLGLLLAGCGATVADSATMENEASFLTRCRVELLETLPQAASWADAHCAERWRSAGRAAPIADALLALMPKTGDAVTADMRGRLTAVHWSSATEGTLGELTVTLPASDRISFHWQKQGGEAPYDLIQALRIRGVTLESLGCPRYPMASMGQEKVMIAKAEGHTPFVLTVYGRFAPTGVEFALYDVDADFTGVVPDSAALAAGQYPGGGGRAFAVDPAGWMATCPDPVS